MNRKKTEQPNIVCGHKQKMALAQNLERIARGTLAIARRWMLTINNPTFEESEKLYLLGHHRCIDCLVYGAEHCDQGTPHFQIYAHFKTPWRWARLKALFPRADIEIANKPKLACCRYCAKEGFYYAFGNVPDLTTGHRRGSVAQAKAAQELARETVVNQARKGKIRYRDLSDEQMLDDKLCKGLQRALSVTIGPRRPNRQVICFISPTGWGKSYSVWTTFESVTTVEFAASQEWFINPEEDVMLFDEFCGQIRCQKMLKYLDGYPISLPIKGGHRPCYWKAIFICSNTSPDMWYTKENEKTGARESTIPEDVRQALYRRLGYPLANANGQTHVYSETFSSRDAARQEMIDICKNIKEQMEQDPSDEEEGDVATYMMEDAGRQDADLQDYT